MNKQDRELHKVLKQYVDPKPEEINKEEDDDKFLEMPIENIIHMKKFFMKQGYDPTDDEFIEKLYLTKDNDNSTKNYTISYEV